MFFIIVFGIIWMPFSGPGAAPIKRIRAGTPARMNPWKEVRRRGGGGGVMMWMRRR